MKKRFSIILINWHAKKVILRCLESIKRAGYLENVVVVDNGSNDGSLIQIKKNYIDVQTVELEENIGFSAGNNVGIKHALDAGAKYFLILNPDTILQKLTIERLIKVLKYDKSTGIIGPKILDINGKIWSCGGILDNKRFSGGLIRLGEENNDQYNKKKEVDFISGTFMMVREDVLEKVGLFHEQYFIYYEDVELNLRAKKAGFKIYYEPKATIIHKESSSMGKNSPAQEYYMARNHLLFVERNAPLRVKLRELIRMPKTLYEHIDRKEKFALLGIRDYFLRRFGKRDYWS